MCMSRCRISPPWRRVSACAAATSSLSTSCVLRRSRLKACRLSSTRLGQPKAATGASTPIEHGSFASLVAQDRVAGAQFHPERSGSAGAALLRDVVSWASDADAA